MSFPLLLDSSGCFLHLLEFDSALCGPLTSSFEPVAEGHAALAGWDELGECGVLVALGCTLRQLRAQIVDRLVSLDQLRTTWNPRT
jgi:hypothetical protein